MAGDRRQEERMAVHRRTPVEAADDSVVPRFARTAM
jgi:hypothetical protein